MTNPYKDEIPHSVAAIKEKPDHVDMPLVKVDIQDFPKGGTYKVDDYIMAAAYYVIMGTSVQVSKFTGIPSRTIRKWTGQGWWKDLVRVVRIAKQDELDAKLTNIIMTASEKLGDRIIHGDTKYINGEMVLIPLNATTIATVLGITYDKRALLRGDPTSRTEQVKDSTTILRELQDRFAEMAANYLPKPIEGEVIKENVPCKEDQRNAINSS